jgi:hypothetical protein
MDQIFVHSAILRKRDMPKQFLPKNSVTVKVFGFLA